MAVDSFIIKYIIFIINILSIISTYIIFILYTIPFIFENISIINYFVIKKTFHNFAELFIHKFIFMKTQIIKTNFNFGLTTLVTFGDRGISSRVRDHDILLSYGIDDAYMSLFSSILEEVRNFPTDIEYMGKVKDLRETKVIDAENLTIAIRSMMSRVVNVFPRNSGKWIRFDTKGLNKMSDTALHDCGLRVVRMATLFLTQLASKGVTVELIDDLQTLSNKLLVSIEAHDDAALERIAATADRIEVANKLYGMIVELFSYGKDYWSSRNYARYKAYIIYNTPTAKPKLSGKTCSVSGSLLDAQTLEPTPNAKINLEYVKTPIIPNASGFWHRKKVPIECTQFWAESDQNTLQQGKITLIENQNTHLNILIEPKSNPPPREE